MIEYTTESLIGLEKIAELDMKEELRGPSQWFKYYEHYVLNLETHNPTFCDKSPYIKHLKTIIDLLRKGRRTNK